MSPLYVYRIAWGGMAGANLYSDCVILYPELPH